MARILFLTTQLPYPPQSGGVMKSWNLVRAFSQEYDLGLVALLKNEDAQHEQEFLDRLTLHHYQSFACDNPRNIKNYVNSYLRSQTLNLYRNFSAEAQTHIRKIAGDYDLILADHYEMFQYIPDDYSGKVVLHEHNAEYVMWDRFATVENNLLRKNLLFMESRRIKLIERKYCERADLVFASPNDQLALQSLGIPKSKFRTTYHLGNDQFLNLPDPQWENTSLDLVFVGTLSWEANVDGVLHFLKDIFPHILEVHPESRFTLVGKDADNRLLKAANKWGDRVEVTGFVPEMDPYLKRARVFVLPLRFGSGMKVKFLDAMYWGIPVVSTPVGAEGLEVRHEKEAMITADVRSFASACNRLLQDQDLWKELSVNSRQIAQNQYTWSALLKNMIKEMNELLLSS